MSSLYALDAGDLGYRVEQWSDDNQKIWRTLAASMNHAIAMSAFEASTRRETYGDSRLKLRKGSMVVREYTPQRLKARDHRTVEQVMERHSVPAGEPRAVKDEIVWEVEIGTQRFAFVALHQFVQDLRKHGHDDAAKPYAEAIDVARKGSAPWRRE